MIGRHSNSDPVRLVINADDFGYFDQVTSGIMEAMESGVVTATGIMANGPALSRWADRLRSVSSVSLGVHLNATLGKPLTPHMCSSLARWGGLFPGKAALGLELLRDHALVRCVMDEWRAQLEYCLNLGLKICFVNSHEHIHMLPSLYGKVRSLADEYGIPHVRAPHLEWGPLLNIAGCVRNAVFLAAKSLAPGSSRQEPVLIGVSSSGKLSQSYFEWRFAHLKSGVDYELMCHPGRIDPSALAEPKLAKYHDWEGELQVLMSEEFMELLSINRIKLCSYADMDQR